MQKIYDYIIVGDFKTCNMKTCMIMSAGTSYEKAKEILNRMITNPTPEDKVAIKDAVNVRIESVERKDCWWHSA